MAAVAFSPAVPRWFLLVFSTKMLLQRLKGVVGTMLPSLHGLMCTYSRGRVMCMSGERGDDASGFCQRSAHLCLFPGNKLCMDTSAGFPVCL